MTKLKRLLKKCLDQNNPNTGTAESFNSALKDLGRWVLTLYTNGKLTIDNDKSSAVHIYEELNIKDFIEEIGNLSEDYGYWKGRGKTFGELIADCHFDLSKVLEEEKLGYHASYTYYREDSEPLGVPAGLADVIIRIFVICYHYEIDIEKILIEKREDYKSKNPKLENKSV